MMNGGRDNDARVGKLFVLLPFITHHSSFIIYLFIYLFRPSHFVGIERSPVGGLELAEVEDFGSIGFLQRLGSKGLEFGHLGDGAGETPLDDPQRDAEPLGYGGLRSAFHKMKDADFLFTRSETGEAIGHGCGAIKCAFHIIYSANTAPRRGDLNASHGNSIS
jgi:hypothetical protein